MTKGWAVLLAVVVGSTATAQTEAGGVQSVCHLPALAEPEVSTSAHFRKARPVPCSLDEQTARFEVTYEGFTPDAERAFQAAVDTWACRIHADHPIRVQAVWSPLERGTLGTAGPFLYRNFDGAPARNVWYPAALADQLAGHDLDADQPHVVATFNSDFSDWHLDLATPPEGSYDLFTVVLHELGHGLGFIGAMTVEDSRGHVGLDPGGPYVYDLLSQDSEGRPLLSGSLYPTGSQALSRVLREDVFLAGPALAQVSARPVPLFTPPQWQPGGSYSHVDEDAYPSGTPNGLMTPFIGRGEAIDAPGAVVCAALADIGWRVSGECARLVGPLPLQNGGGVMIQRTGPNPVRQATTFRLVSPAIRPVEVRLVDVLGRQVAVLEATVLMPGREHEVRVSAAGLTAGVYMMVVTGGPMPQTVALLVSQ